MKTRLTSRSDGRGLPASKIIKSWAASNPKIRRVWLSANPEKLGVMVELHPVGDSEETMAVWMAHCDSWRAELKARLGQPVEIDWYDADTETPAPPSAHDGKSLVYERAS